MEFSRTKNSTRTFIFGVLSRFITVIGPFITRTIIIHKLGTEYLGLSSLFTSVLSILNISELGIGSAITFCLYKPVADDDRDTVRALLSLLRKLYKLIGCIVLGVGLILLPFLPYLIKGDCPPDINIYILYVIYLVNSCASYLGYAYKAVLFNAYQRGDISHKIETGAEVIKSILQIIVLLLFSNYYWFACLLPVSTIIVTIATQIFSKKLFPDLYPQGTVDTAIKKTIKKKVLFLSAHSIAATLTNSVDNIVISGAIGLTAIALYGNYHYISSSVLAILLIAYRALQPAIGNSLVSKTSNENIELFEGLNFLCFWIISFCCSSLITLYQPFMKLWVGESNLLDFFVVIMVTAYFYSNATRQFFGVYVSAAGLWSKTLLRQILAAISNLTLDLILVGKFGIAGIVFSSFFTNVIVALPMDIYVAYKYILKTGVRNGYVTELIYSLITIVVCFLTYSLCGIVMIEGVVGFIIKSVLCLIVPNIMMYVTMRKTSRFEYIKTRILTLMRKR